jgi:3-oxoacyl-[acyl-carrier-protein] synthase-3
METDIFVRATGRLLPERILSNYEITDLLSRRSPPDVPPALHQHALRRAELTETKTGIRERRFFAETEDVITIARRLSTQLVPPDVDWATVDAILVASSSIQGFPGVSQQLVPVLRADHPALGHPFVLDLTSNACTSFLYALGVSVALMRSFGYRNVLCLAVELASRCISYDVRHFGISTLFGDAAAGMLLSTQTGFARLTALHLGSRIGADTVDLIRGSGSFPGQPGLELPPELRWQVDGPKVALAAVDLLAEAIRRHAAAGAAFDWLIPHQANWRGILLPACRKADVSPERMLRTIDFMANTSTASVPFTFDHYRAQQHFRPGERILLVGFGASFTVASAMVEMAIGTLPY